MNFINQSLKYMRVFCFVFITALAASPQGIAQEKTASGIDLNRNITIRCENEPMADFIRNICEFLNLDYSYNSKLAEEKNISLNISDKPIKYVLDKLMKDFNLIFEVENNIMNIREYVPLNESLKMEQTYESVEVQGFLFENIRKKSITIPFKLVNNLIIMPLTINDSDTLNFILDTGVSVPLITELPFVNNLNLNYLIPVKMPGLASGEKVTVYLSSGNIIRVKNMVVQNQAIRMIIDDRFQISKVMGMPVHGLIGLNLFKDYIVKIDYSHKHLTLYRHEHYKHRYTKRDISLPLYFEAGKPFVNINIRLEDNQKVPVKLLVDTGASDALWLSEKSDERIKLPPRHIETFLGKSLIGDLYGKKARIEALWVGPLVMSNPIATFPDSEVIDQLIEQSDRNGTLGAEILRRFILTFDYRNARLTLSPTSMVNDNFNYNMSGMEIENPMPGFPIYTISNIREGSPAHLAGLRRDDQIITINNNHHSSISLNDINIMIQSREKKKIKMKVLRDGRELTAVFALQSLF
ncbi:MAG: aspartyl protease family protein [Prolixibacteraceae bacterium]|nr:aspartyl protease family protein [Prolixibacteraceae bacterium]